MAHGGSSSTSSSGNSSDEGEREDTILMGEYKGNSAAYDDYDLDKARPQRRRILRTRSQLGRTLRLGRLHNILHLFIAQPKVQNALNSLISAPNRENIQHHLIAFLLFLLPSFIYPWNPPSKPKKPNKMAYLDGLRGVAALFVMIHHYTCQFTPALLEGWGSDIQADGTNENAWLLQLPFIRVIHSGSFMVVLFFVISGCVLSARGLKLARDRKKPEFMSSLASSMFRRWIRLHLPVIASMCIAFIISRNEGWTHLKPDWLAPPGAAISNSTSTVVSNLTVLTPAPLKNVTIVEESASMLHLLARSGALNKRKFRLLWDWTGAKKNESLTFQIGDFFWGIVDVCDPFRGGGVPGIQSAGYNSGMILWTIPSEWLGSIVVFVVVLGIAWTRTWLKLSILAFMVLWCHYSAKWSLATFLSGTFIAELTLIRDERLAEQNVLPNTDLPLVPDEKEGSSSFLFVYRTQIKTASWIALFLVGIYIGAIPLISWGTCPGFITLRSLIPQWYFAKDLFYPCLGSMFIMLSITYCVPVQRLFSSKFPQYLGRISFSLYLLHTQILTTMGIRVFTACMKMIGGGEGQVGFAMGVALGSAVMFPITFWVADVFTRAVDERSVEFARWVAGRALLLDGS